MEWTTMERLRMYTGEAERIEGLPAYEYIVKAAHEGGLAGATAMRGIMGYSGNSVVHTAKILRLTENLPILIEIIDTADKIEAFCATELIKLKRCLLTRDTVSVKVIRN